MDLKEREYKVNQLYEEQQAYFAQFNNERQLKQEPIRQLKLEKIDNRIFVENLVKQKKEKIRKPKEQIDVQNIIGNTTTLILDCNNMKYSGEKWNQFHGKPLKQIIQSLKIVMLWCQQQGNILKNVNLIWDVLNKKIFNEISNSDDINFPFIQACPSNSQNGNQYIISNGMGEFLNLTIASSKPQIADDYIVEILKEEDNSKTTVVTSDQILRQRLRDIGVQNFIGNGSYWRLQQLIDLQSQKT